MVIRTITFHHEYNFGAMLQAYALIAYLRSLGHDVRAIDYRAPYSPIRKINFKWVPPELNLLVVKQLYCIYKYRRNKLEQKRRDAFEVFFNKYIPVTDIKYHSIEEIRANPPSADLYIAGSDQIWNTLFPNGTDAAFYLDFGGNTRRISYAASIAVERIDGDKEPFVKNHLRRFDAISVREQSGQKLLDSYGFESCVVVDPVFFLDKNQWCEFCSDELFQYKYILVYDFEPKGRRIARLAKRVARLMKCKIYSVGPFSHQYADKSFVDVGPEVFLSMVNNAQCVISNSFHGTAFSIIFGKNFFVVDREDGLNVRMHDLLGKYGLTNRLADCDINDEMLLKSIDYSRIENLLRQDIDNSKLFLLRQIRLA